MSESLGDIRREEEQRRFEREKAAEEARAELRQAVASVQSAVVHPAMERFADRIRKEEDFGRAEAYPGRLFGPTLDRVGVVWTAQGHREAGLKFEVTATTNANTGDVAFRGTNVQQSLSYQDITGPAIDQLLFEAWRDFHRRRNGN